MTQSTNPPKAKRILREILLTLALTALGGLIFWLSLQIFPNNHPLHFVAMVLTGALVSFGIIRILRASKK